MNNIAPLQTLSLALALALPVSLALQPAFAQDAAEPAPPVAVVEAEVALVEDDQLVIEYIEADLQSVLRSLASRAGINLILDDDVVGTVTLHLEGIGYEEAMREIAESKGYAVIKTANGIVKIRSKGSLDLEPIKLEIFTLDYAKADAVRGTIQPLLSNRGSVQVDTRSNTLIVSDTESNLAKIKPLIEERLDVETPQVLIEAKFVETTKNPRKDLGINWAGTLRDKELRAKGMSGGEEGDEAASAFSLGKNLAGGPWTPSTVILDAGDASVVFSFLASDNESELLANPRVVATDNQRARISIGRQYPIPNFSFSEQTASLQINGFEYKDIGIILDVVPRVNKNSYVTLEVTPEASSSNEFAPLQSGGGSAVAIPIINTRTASTTVLIKSGNTLAIGGLMQQDTTDLFTKVPIMGDIPGLGAFFRSKSVSKIKRDLLIFLTPTVIRGDGQTGYEKFVDGLPAEELYANDKWMPTDNAKPRARTPNQYFNVITRDSQPAAAAPAPVVEPLIEFAPASPAEESEPSAGDLVPATAPVSQNFSPRE